MAEHKPGGGQFTLDAEIVAQLGPVPAVIHAVLLANAGPDGTAVMAQGLLAVTVGLSVDSVQRHLKPLCDAGLLKVEHQYRDNRQRVSRYHFIGPGQNENSQVRAGPQIAVAISSSFQTQTNLPPSNQHPSGHPPEGGGCPVMDGTCWRCVPSPSLVGPAGAGPPEGDLPQQQPPDHPLTPLAPCHGERSLVFRRIPLPSPLPPGSCLMAAILHHHRQAEWLVGRLCDHLLARGDSPAKLFRRVDGFYLSAWQGVSDHPAVQIAAVTDHVFGVCGGDLPAVITRDLDAYIPPRRQQELTRQGTRLPLADWISPRVTSLRQITHPSHYPQLLGCLGRSPTKGA